jgi:hypothetical protein
VLSGNHAIIYALILLPPTLALLWVATGLSAREPEISLEPNEEKEYRTGVLDVVLGGITHGLLAFTTAWRRAWPVAWTTGSSRHPFASFTVCPTGKY